MEARERLARVLYQCESKRSARVDEMLSFAARKTIGPTMEPWEECREIFEADADAILKALHLSDTAALALMDRPKYRLLESTDVIRKGDQVIDDDGVTWVELVGWEIGIHYTSRIFKSVRRRVTQEGSDQ